MDRSAVRLQLASIGLAAVVTILLQLVATRILSFVYWNHIVYLTVTIALLGFGISGSLLAVLRDKALDRPGKTYSELWFGLGITTLITLVATAAVTRGLIGAPVWIKLGISYLIFIGPFIFAGAIISLHLSNAKGVSVGRLYGVDLACCGLACLGFGTLLYGLGATGLVCALAVACFAISGLWWQHEFGQRRPAALVFTVAAGLITIAASLDQRLLDFQPEAYKEQGQAVLASPDIAIEKTSWTSIARIDVMGRDDDGPMVPYYDMHPVGSYKIITQDATAHTRLLSDAAVKDLAAQVAEGRETHGSNLAYELREEPEVAIIGVGGGVDVASALAYGAQRVVGLELNPVTAGYAKETYRDYTGGLLDDPRVDLVVSEGRSFLARTPEEVDLLQVIAIDTFAALSSGAYVLSENYLYTVEAFRAFYQTLKPDGMLSFYRFLFHPPRETLRLVTVAAEAWEAEGNTDFAGSVAVFGGTRENWGLAVFKRTPFTPAELEKLMEGAERRGLVVLYFPKILPEAEQAELEQAYYAEIDEKFRASAAAFDGAVRAFRAGTEDEFLTNYRYNVAPTTDDSPFFFE